MINNKITKLREEVLKHDNLYNLGKPEITDTEYDKLYSELLSLEKNNPELDDKNSPTQRIVASESNKASVRHNSPMLSLEKANEFEEVESFIKRINSPIMLQEKLDGLSIVLRYEDHLLVQAITRGNGLIGEDVTHIVQKFKNVPKRISEKTLEVRGEIIMPHLDFERVNVDNKYSNPRNYASGQLRRIDNIGIENLGLKVIAYSIVSDIKTPTNRDSERLEFLSKLGFEIVAYKKFDNKDLDGLRESILEYENKLRDELPYMIDGLVIVMDSISERDKFGSTSKHPKWAIAYKFESLDATTNLIDVTWGIGKQGQLTPVGVLDAVVIDNVNISNATLHNVKNIKDKDIRIGDRVLIKRANDVIPYIIGSIPEVRSGLEKDVIIPKVCPSCESPTEFKGENLYCTNKNCEPQLKARLVHYASRDAMDIDGLAEATIEMFYEESIIRSILDIYNLVDKKEDILKLRGYGEKKFNRIIKSVEETKKKDFNHFLYGLSINNIGRSASKEIAGEFKDIDNILGSLKDVSALKERLLTLPKFGNTLADNFIEFLLDEENIKMINALKDHGVNMKTVENEDVNIVSDKDSKVFGKHFAITGKLEILANRNELQSLILAKGGLIAKKVGKKVDFLVNNDTESNSSKNKEAKKLGIPIISEKEVLEMID